MEKFVKTYQKGKLLTYKVNNRNDAVKALKRLKVPAGWYCEKRGGVITVNEKIFAR